ncbi:SDR family oxidoreductase [Kutzneria sp. 744]|uniref:SDR family oxidoreductase n=1 Tax=Kutzneria sp. (strain 744) TaxID=345341 RepID=UPI0003EEC086|nr:SDR family oxidoreductase [Kutzneria sp. 744]EWM13644.1 NAD-binding protein [Kutzneria sp. 744]
MNVIVTGAAGLVGAEVCARLAAAGHGVIAMTHRRTTVADQSTTPFTRLAVDITRPDLGLTPRQVDQLCGGRCTVVHAAAVTEFGRDDGVYDAVNVRGTAHVLALARRGEMPFVHVSTAYVCGEHDGSFANGYERSKAAAESLVHGSGLDVVVIRPSIVVGTESTGAIRVFRNIYVMLRLIAEGKVGTLPGRYDACLDLVAVDRVADLVTDAAHRFGEVRGQTLPAIAGRPVTLRECSEVFAEYPSLRAPRFVPPEVFRLDTLPPTQRRYHDRVVRLYEPYFRRRTTFDDSATRAFHRRRPALTGVAHLRRLLDYCLAIGYLR